METLNEKHTRPAPAHFCCGGIAIPGSAVKPNRPAEQQPITNPGRDNQKPWSIFGDVYWI